MHRLRGVPLKLIFIFTATIYWFDCAVSAQVPDAKGAETIIVGQVVDESLSVLGYAHVVVESTDGKRYSFTTAQAPESIVTELMKLRRGDRVRVVARRNEDGSISPIPLKVNEQGGPPNWWIEYRFATAFAFLIVVGGVTILILGVVSERRELRERERRERHPYSLPGMDFLELAKAGKIAVSCVGSGLSKVRVSVRLTCGGLSSPVRIPAGTVFQSPEGSVQSMISTIDISECVTGDEAQEFVVPAACLNMRLRPPGRKDLFGSFSQFPTSIPADLVRLVTSHWFQYSSSRVRQFAIWTITDNPDSTAYTGIVGVEIDLYAKIGIAVDRNIASSGGPTHTELDIVRSLLHNAGIETTKYRACLKA